ncbi:MAG: LysR family transcriptional regulator, partial [Pseudomonadota bacterium]|nr:LysR family transcriptional regulator [Pseudomonadota bacterium]
FGINQVLANKGVVFCSKTLVQPYLDAGLLTSFNSQDVESKLCYYIPEKSRFETATHNVVIEWLERLLN